MGWQCWHIAAAGLALLERGSGIEPSYAACEPAILALSYARFFE